MTWFRKHAECISRLKTFRNVWKSVSAFSFRLLYLQTPQLHHVSTVALAVDWVFCTHYAATFLSGKEKVRWRDCNHQLQDATKSSHWTFKPTKKVSFNFTHVKLLECSFKTTSGSSWKHQCIPFWPTALWTFVSNIWKLKWFKWLFFLFQCSRGGTSSSQQV